MQNILYPPHQLTHNILVIEAAAPSFVSITSLSCSSSTINYFPPLQNFIINAVRSLPGPASRSRATDLTSTFVKPRKKDNLGFFERLLLDFEHGETRRRLQQHQPPCQILQIHFPRSHSESDPARPDLINLHLVRPLDRSPATFTTRLISSFIQGNPNWSYPFPLLVKCRCLAT